MLGIITHNRDYLLKTSLDSLLQAGGLGGVLILDDCSGPSTRRLLESYSTLPISYNETNIGADQNTYKLCDMLAERESHFVISGSDIIYSKLWHHRLIDLYKNSCDKVAMIGAFRGTNHDLSIREIDGGLLEMPTLTGPCLVSSDFWRKYRTEVNPNRCDWTMAEAAIRNGYKILCVKDSLVQHIGVMDGLHLNNPDVGIRFVGQDCDLTYDFEEPDSKGAKFSYSSDRRSYDLTEWIQLYFNGIYKTNSGVLGAWREDSRDRFILRDYVWTRILHFDKDTFCGFAYPCGTSIVGTGRSITGRSMGNV